MPAFEQTLAMLADVARGKVRAGWDANDKPVMYVASEKATPAQRNIIGKLQLSGRVQPGAGGQYLITRDGMTFLNTHYPTWRS